MKSGALKIVIRERLATVDDLAEIARVHKLAYSRNHFTALLPDPILMQYYGTFLNGNTTISLVLSNGEEIKGFTVYGTGIPEKIAAFKKACVKDILLTSLKHPWISTQKAVKAVAARLSTLTPYPPAEFLLLSIAVAEPLRGIGKVLLNATITAARERGHQRLGLYVNDNNILAINAYHAVGFRIQSFHAGQYYMEANLID